MSEVLAEMVSGSNVTTSNAITSYELFGRRKIYTPTEEITKDNVLEEVNTALTVHVLNMMEMEFLYWYRRGLQPILNRKKEVRPEIKNTIVENHADEIVSFKNGYFLTQPAFYISRKDGDDNTEKVKQLNEYLYRSGKQQADNQLVDWFHTVGKADLFVEPTNDEDTPVRAYALDPRSAFVVYSLRPGNRPKFCVNMVINNDNKVLFDVITEQAVYRLSGGITGRIMTDTPIVASAIYLDSIEPNPLKKLPIIEYYYNSVNMGAFEAVVPLLDALNNIMSNRADGIEQFIQSLAVATNCQFEEGTTANSIRQAGMIVLRSIGENKADFKILSEQLDQGQTQVLVDYIYEKVLSIVGMPSTTKGGASTSDTGAAVLARDGWYQADTVARNTEDIFKESNRYFDEVFIEILKRKVGLNINISDFELQFIRNETANVLAKAQAATTMLAAGFAPALAFGKSGVSNDPVQDVALSEKYLKMIWGDPDKPNSQGTENVELVEETRTDDTSGSI